MPTNFYNRLFSEKYRSPAGLPLVTYSKKNNYGNL